MLLKRYNKANSSLTMYPRSGRQCGILKAFSQRKQLAPLTSDLTKSAVMNSDNLPISDMIPNEPTTCVKPSSSKVLSKLPPIPKVSAPEYKKIMLEKLELCSIICDFKNSCNDKSAKSIKNKTLIEINNNFLQMGFASHFCTTC